MIDLIILQPSSEPLPLSWQRMYNTKAHTRPRPRPRYSHTLPRSVPHTQSTLHRASASIHAAAQPDSQRVNEVACQGTVSDPTPTPRGEAGLSIYEGVHPRTPHQKQRDSCPENIKTALGKS